MSVRLRILGHAATLTVHAANIVHMARTSASSQTQDKNILVFKSLEYRFLTTWTFMLQIGYAILGIYCDLRIMKNSSKKDYRLPKTLREFRHIMFAGLVWPSSWVVFSVFWSLYIYDRSLIYPEYLDQVLTTLSNHVIHTFIIPVVIWELVFWPRSNPKTHARNVMQMVMHGTVYLSVLLFTYFERGVWLYPIFGKLYGTIYFGVAILAVAILFLIFYFIQWPITLAIHGTGDKLKKKVR